MTLVADQLQAVLDNINKENPPDYVCPPYLGNFRHKCSAQRNVSKPIDLKEMQIDRIVTWEGDELSGEPVMQDTYPIALIYREGMCRLCKQVARSDVGRIIDMEERPPLSGRVGRQ